jgi:hypothetical protein
VGLKPSSAPEPAAPPPPAAAPAPPPAAPASGLGALLAQAEDVTKKREDDWIAVEQVARRGDLPAAQRAQSLKQFLATYPEGNPHAEYANLLISALETSGDTDEFLMDPTRLRAKTEWVSLRFEGGSYGGGALLSLFTVRWRWVYWEIIRGGGGAGMPTHGGVSVWSLGGTALGVPIHFGITGRHEVRIGLGIMGGLMQEYHYDTPTSYTDSYGYTYYNQDTHSAASFGPIFEPEASYLFHAASYFALQVGVAVYVAAVAGEGEIPAPIFNAFLGFRI